MKNSAHNSVGRPSSALFFALAAMAVAAIPMAALLAQPVPQPAGAGGQFTIMETGRSYGSLQQAIDAIGSGNGTIAIDPGTYRECGVQEAGNISYLATQPGRAIFSGVACEGKAALVLRGRSASISGLVFSDIAVPDGNGAGLRIETGNVTVAQSWFRDSQSGILSAGDYADQIVIDKSTFTRLGTCDYGDCAHSIYGTGGGSLRVTRSRFEQGTGGHYLKSRAPFIQIAGCSFDDAQGSGTNYHIDLPNGATGQITNNWFMQGSDKENYSAIITVAPEDPIHSSDDLQIAANVARLAPGAAGTQFVADWSGARLSIEGNQLDSRIDPFESRR